MTYDWERSAKIGLEKTLSNIRKNGASIQEEPSEYSWSIFIHFRTTVGEKNQRNTMSNGTERNVITIGETCDVTVNHVI